MNYTEITKDRPRQSACEYRPPGYKESSVRVYYLIPPSKHANYAAIDLSSTRTVSDRPRLAAYRNKHCWQAFRGTRLWPWTLKYRFLVIFFLISGCDAHLGGIFAEITGDRPIHHQHWLRFLVTWPILAILCRLNYFIVFYWIAFHYLTGHLRCKLSLCDIIIIIIILVST